MSTHAHIYKPLWKPPWRQHGRMPAHASTTHVSITCTCILAWHEQYVRTRLQAERPISWNKSTPVLLHPHATSLLCWTHFRLCISRNVLHARTRRTTKDHTPVCKGAAPSCSPKLDHWGSPSGETEKYQRAVEVTVTTAHMSRSDIEARVCADSGCATLVDPCEHGMCISCIYVCV
jgi:hypothetical protein